MEHANNFNSGEGHGRMASSPRSVEIELTRCVDAPGSPQELSTSRALFDVLDPSADLADGIHLLSRASLAERFQTSLEGAQPAPAAAAAATITACDTVSLTHHIDGKHDDAAHNAANAADVAAPVVFRPDRGAGAPLAAPTVTLPPAAGTDAPLASALKLNEPERESATETASATVGAENEAAADAAAAAQTRARLTERHRRHSLSHIAAEDADPRLCGGLSPAAHEARLAAWGPNVVRPMSRRPAWLRYLVLYTEPFMVALTAAATLSLAMYGTDTSDRTNLIVGLCLVAVVVFSCSSEFYQDNKSSSRMSAFAALVPRQTLVLRAGRRQLVPAATLAPGDVVVLRTGDQVAADMRLIAANGLKIDASAVTGEA